MKYQLQRGALKLRTKTFELLNRTSWKPFLKQVCPKSLQKELRRKHIEKLGVFPEVISIETTNNCNARCWFCPTHKASRKKGFMEFELFKHIIDELAPNAESLKSVALFMDGEPTLHPELLRFIRYASDAGIRNMYLSSNMEYFTPELVDSLFETDLKGSLQYIMCSLDGTSEKVHKKNRVGVNFNTALSNTLYLLKKRDMEKSLYPMVFTRLLVSDTTRENVEKFKAYWKGKADKVLCYGMHNWGGLIKSKALQQSDNDDFKPCYFPFSQCAIQFDGSIRLCCVDSNSSVVIGNVKDDSINNIMTSARIEQVRKSHIERDFASMPDICTECSYPRKGMWVAPFFW